MLCRADRAVLVLPRPCTLRLAARMSSGPQFLPPCARPPPFPRASSALARRSHRVACAHARSAGTEGTAGRQEAPSARMPPEPAQRRRADPRPLLEHPRAGEAVPSESRQLRHLCSCSLEARSRRHRRRNAVATPASPAPRPPRARPAAGLHPLLVVPLLPLLRPQVRAALTCLALQPVEHVTARTSSVEEHSRTPLESAPPAPGGPPPPGGRPGPRPW